MAMTKPEENIVATASLSSNLLARKGQALPSVALASSVPEAASVKMYGILKELRQTQNDPSNRDSSRDNGDKVRKSLLLGLGTHHKLRLLADRYGVTQQQLMEQAVEIMIQEMTKSGTCICGGLIAEG